VIENRLSVLRASNRLPKRTNLRLRQPARISDEIVGRPLREQCGDQQQRGAQDEHRREEAVAGKDMPETPPRIADEGGS